VHSKQLGQVLCGLRLNAFKGQCAQQKKKPFPQTFEHLQDQTPSMMPKLNVILWTQLVVVFETSL
jgi:hypothetical protein